MGIPGQLINVGCMMPYMDYTPRTLAELLEANPMPVIARIRKDGTPAGNAKIPSAVDDLEVNQDGG